MSYVACRWELDTNKSEKKTGYAIIELSTEFTNLIESSNFVFNEIPSRFWEQKISKHKRRGEIETREYSRYKRISVGQKIYVQRQDLKKQPFISMSFPIIWRKKHIQSFYSQFVFKYWCKITWKEGKQIIPANHKNVIFVMPEKIPVSTSPAKVILR